MPSGTFAHSLLRILLLPLFSKRYIAVDVDTDASLGGPMRKEIRRARLEVERALTTAMTVLHGKTAVLHGKTALTFNHLALREMLRHWETHSGHKPNWRQLSGDSSNVNSCHWDAVLQQCLLDNDFVNSLDLPPSLKTFLSISRRSTRCLQHGASPKCDEDPECILVEQECSLDVPETQVMRSLMGLFDYTECGFVGLVMKNNLPCMDRSSHASCHAAGRQCSWKTYESIKCPPLAESCSICSKGFAHRCTTGSVTDLAATACPESTSTFDEMMESCNKEIDRSSFESSMNEILDGLATCIERECQVLGQFLRKVMPKSMSCGGHSQPAKCNRLFDCRWNAQKNECEPDIWSTIDDKCPFKDVLIAEMACAQTLSMGECHQPNGNNCEWRQEFHCMNMTISERPTQQDRCQLSPAAATLHMFGEGDPDKVAIIELLHAEDRRCQAALEPSLCSHKFTDEIQANLSSRIVAVRDKENKFANAMTNADANEEDGGLMGDPAPPSNVAPHSHRILSIVVGASMLSC